MTDSTHVRNLHELISALDRRRPRPERASEAAIAHESSELRTSAIEQLSELEPRRAPSPDSPSDPSTRC